MNIETVLHRILKAVVKSNSLKKDKYGQTILEIALRKGIDLEEGDIDGTGNYSERIFQCGIDSRELEKAMLMMNSKNQNEKNCQYHIYNDQKKGDKKRINLGQEFNCEMKTFLISVSQKGQGAMSHQNYQLKVEIVDGKFIASYQ